MKKFLIACVLGFCAAAATSSDDMLNDVPDKYTVKKGDTLWDISEHFLKSPWLWPEIWHVNSQIKNPHLIYPGDVIRLVYIDGKPRLVVERNRNVKMGPKIREMGHVNPIPALPLDAINSFLSKNRVVDPGVLEAAPYVLAGAERHVLSGAGHDFYARGGIDNDVPVYGIYRKGEPYVDPTSGELLGIRAKDIGSAKLKAMENDVGTLYATRSVEEIRIEDRLLPHEERKIDAVFYPKSPETDVEGMIIAVEDGIAQVGPLDVVAINKGERESLQVGDVLAVFRAGEVVKDRVTNEAVVLPAERAGLVMIFRTFEKMSYGLVMKSDRPLKVLDIVRNP